MTERKSRKKKNPYLGSEEKIMNALAVATNFFRKLDTTHPCHQKDFIDGIHKCQDVIIHRIVQRAYPEEFPTYKNKILIRAKEARCNLEKNK